jgi:hypothetical protein
MDIFNTKKLKEANKKIAQLEQAYGELYDECEMVKTKLKYGTNFEIILDNVACDFSTVSELKIVEDVKDSKKRTILGNKIVARIYSVTTKDKKDEVKKEHDTKRIQGYRIKQRPYNAHGVYEIKK